MSLHPPLQPPQVTLTKDSHTGKGPAPSATTVALGNARRRPAHPTLVWGVCGTWPEAAFQRDRVSTLHLPALHSRRVVSIPASALEPTAGSQSYANGRATAFLPVCDAFHRGTCSQGFHCAYLHVQPAYMDTLVASPSTCCGRCGDAFTRRTLIDVPELRHLTFDVFAVAPSVDPSSIPGATVQSHHVSQPQSDAEGAADGPDLHSILHRDGTPATLAQLRISQLAITTAVQRGESVVCDEHVSSAFVDAEGECHHAPCARGKDCPKYHLCRNIFAGLRARAPSDTVLLLRIGAVSSPDDDHSSDTAARFKP
jgi:hypothetical protein